MLVFYSLADHRDRDVMIYLIEKLFQVYTDDLFADNLALALPLGERCAPDGIHSAMMKSMGQTVDSELDVKLVGSDDQLLSRCQVHDNRLSVWVS